MEFYSKPISYVRSKHLINYICTVKSTSSSAKHQPMLSYTIATVYHTVDRTINKIGRLASLTGDRDPYCAELA